MSSGVTI